LKRIITILTLLFITIIPVYAQSKDNVRVDSLRKEAPVERYATPDEDFNGDFNSSDLSKRELRELKRATEEKVHSPHKATIYAMVCPGLGQIYNKQYWKLPILYGGVALAIYGVTWNNQAYTKYRDAYLDLSNYIDSLSVNPMYPYPEDPAWEKIKIRGTDWKTLFEMRPSSMTRYQSIMYNKRRSFKRNRDLCYLALAGVYLLNVLDACVFAHFYDFSINDDISLHWQPNVSYNHRTGKSRYGASVSLKF
jgi:hypothetical protein